MLVGFSFKENTNDVRNTGVIKIYNHFKKKGNNIEIFDNIADKQQAKKLYNVNLLQKIPNKNYDLVIVCLNIINLRLILLKKILSVSKKAVVYDFKKLLN